MSQNRCNHGIPLDNPCDECDETRSSELAGPAGSPSGIEAEVCHDIAARQQLGIRKYGSTVADNPIGLKGWLQHAYEECLDQAIYLKRAIRELENDKLTA